MRRITEIILSTIVLLILFFQIQDHVFFWDTIQLGAKHALFFYETNFSSLILPEEIDSGHPPLLGILLASAWSLFGKNLIVSHWLMFPFVWGIIFMLFQLGDLFLGPKKAYLLVLLCMLDPVLAGQSILISPDLILVFGFLLGWYGVLKKKTWAKIWAALLLAMVSTRGMMVVVILFSSDLYELWLEHKKISWQDGLNRIWPYVPAGLVGVGFLIYHYLETGWIGYHANSTWAPSFERVNFKGFIRNGVVLTWRLLDFGRIFLWLILITLFIRFWKDLKKWSVNQKRALFMMVLALLLFSLVLLSYKGLLLHRYLLPVYLSFSVFFIVCINHIKTIKARSLIIAIGILGLFSGNMWIYPEKISQGWDSTLAHWPYYSLRRKMLHYLEKNDIPLESIGTVFPEIGPLKYKDISERNEGMVNKNLEKQSHVLYSNVMNDFTDEEIDELRNNWKEVKRLDQRGIKIILYKKYR